MEKTNRKRVLILIITYFVLFCFVSSLTALPIYNELQIYNGKIIKNPQNLKPLLSRYNLEGNDEGPHQNKIFNMKEWWYYCVYFNDENSELKNWCVVTSISISIIERSSLKIKLYDFENKSYGGIYLTTPKNINTTGPGVNINFNNSFIIGRYPDWHVYSEYIETDETEVIVNLKFKANSLPMWIIKNTGQNRSNSFFGYYSIMNCDVHGNISLNGTIYNVSGVGYHDHTWFPLYLQKLNFYNIRIKNNMQTNKLFSISIWDWLCIHFENGWDMFVGKIYSNKNTPGSNFGPGYLCFTPSGKKLYESYFFLIDYKETKNSTIPNIKIPIKIHIKALIFNTIGMYQFKGPILFDFYYEAINIQEELFGSSPNWGIWQSQGKINGYVKNLGKTTPLDGWAIMETTNSLNK